MSPYTRDLAQMYRRAGLTTRRHFLASSLAASVGATLGPDAIQAANKQLTFATWGGAEIKDLTQAFAKPFTRQTGIDVLFDGTGPAEGKISAMVEANAVEWDVCDVDGYVALRLGRAGVLSAIDYSIIDRAQLMPQFAYEHAIAGYTYSFVMAYHAGVYSSRPPMSWVDFFDTKKFPGRRAIWKWMLGAFEAAALAEGATPDKLYPMDIETVINRLTSLGDNLVLWETGDQVRQMLIDRTIGMACLWHSRAAQIAAETSGAVSWSFEQGILCPGMWVIPKRNPGGVDAFRLLAAMQDPALQIELTKLRNLGPANPLATAQMPQALRHIDPTQPETIKQQVQISNEWWADNYDQARLKFQDRLSRG